VEFEFDQKIADVVVVGRRHDFGFQYPKGARREIVVVDELDAGLARAVLGDELVVFDIADQVRGDLARSAIDWIRGDDEPCLGDEIAEGSLDSSLVQFAAAFGDRNHGW